MALPQHFNEIHHICCIGARHASVMSMAIIAEAHPNVIITIVDYDNNVIQRWEDMNIDWIEPGFQQLLIGVLNVNLFFRNQVDARINEAQMIFICVDIPTKLRGIGAGSRPDRTQWERAIRSIMGASQASKVIVEKMNMPVDPYNDTMRLLGQRQQNQVQFAIFSNPDLYIPGRAIETLRNSNRVIIARKSDIGNVNVLQEMYAGYPTLVQHPDKIVVLHDYVSVELARTGTSIMLGAKNTFAKMLSSVCSTTGADFNDVRQVIGGDQRLNNNYMDATLGIGGPDTMKDMLHFKHTLQKHGLGKQARVVNQLVKLNKERVKEFAELVLDEMVSLTNKVIAVFGVTYRSNIADVTNSPAIEVCKALLKDDAVLRIFDPLVTDDAIMGCFRNGDRVEVAENQQQAYNQAHATLCLVATDLQFDFVGMRNAMVAPPYLFIACNLNNINYNLLAGLGFQYYIFGNQFN